MRQKECDKCGKELIRKVDTKRLNKKWYCKECYKEVKKNHREQTIERAGIKEELRELKRKERNERNHQNKEKVRAYNKKRYQEKVGHPVRVYNKSNPLIRRPKRKRYRNLDFQERKVLFNQLTINGMNGIQAKMRIDSLTQFETDLFRELHSKEKLNKNFKEEFLKITQ